MSYVNQSHSYLVLMARGIVSLMVGIDFYPHDCFAPSSKNRNYESLDGQLQERSDCRNHMLRTRIPFIQSFGAPTVFHMHM